MAHCEKRVNLISASMAPNSHFGGVNNQTDKHTSGRVDLDQEPVVRRTGHGDLDADLRSMIN